MMMIFISFSSSFSCSCPVAHFFSPPFPSLDFPTEVRWLYNLQWLLTELHISPSHEGILQLHEITFVIIHILVFSGTAEVAGAGKWLRLVA